MPLFEAGAALPSRRSWPKSEKACAFLRTWPLFSCAPRCLDTRVVNSGERPSQWGEPVPQTIPAAAGGVGPRSQGSSLSVSVHGGNTKAAAVDPGGGPPGSAGKFQMGKESLGTGVCLRSEPRSRDSGSVWRATAFSQDRELVSTLTAATLTAATVSRVPWAYFLTETTQHVNLT